MNKKIVIETMGKNLKGEGVEVSAWDLLRGEDLAKIISESIFTEFNKIVISWGIDFAGSADKIYISIFLDIGRVEYLVECYIKKNIFEVACGGDKLLRIKNPVNRPFFQSDFFPLIVSHINRAINALVEKRSFYFKAL